MAGSTRVFYGLRSEVRVASDACVLERAGDRANAAESGGMWARASGSFVHDNPGAVGGWRPANGLGALVPCIARRGAGG